MRSPRLLSQGENRQGPASKAIPLTILSQLNLLNIQRGQGSVETIVSLLKVYPIQDPGTSVELHILTTHLQSSSQGINSRGVGRITQMDEGSCASAVPSFR